MVTITIDDVRNTLARRSTSGAAVLIPLLSTDAGLEVLLEQRALDLDIQPGEVCLPGGHVEAGESPQQAAVRETCEELLIPAKSVHIIGDLGQQPGPGGMPLWVFVGRLDHYCGTFSTDEVDHTFTLSVPWLLEHEPKVFDVPLTATYPHDLPWDRIPHGRAYPWRTPRYSVPFYLDTNPLVWGVTARILHLFSRTLREGLNL